MLRRFALGSVLMLLISGCGSAEKKVPVKGKLVDGPNPFVLDATKLKLPGGATSLPPGARPLQVSFIPEKGGETQFAIVDVDSGTFTATLAPGTYKIAITASAGMGTPDLFNGKFSAERSQITREVKANEDITIDVSKPNG
jgi:hypothetical protein